MVKLFQEEYSFCYINNFCKEIREISFFKEFLVEGEMCSGGVKEGNDGLGIFNYVLYEEFNYIRK